MKTLLKDINWKFSVVTAALIVAVMLAEQALLMKQARIGMESRLAEKAAFVNTFYAVLIADALQRKDDVTLLQVLNRLEEDPEVTSVVVVDDKGEVRYHADAEKLGTQWNDPMIQKALETGDGAMAPFTNSGGRALALVSPLKVQGKARPLGAVRIDLTYRHVQDMLSKFAGSFHLAVLGFVSSGVGLMLIFVRRWVTLPLEKADMAVAGLHPSTMEANLPESPDEFGRLNKALNDMVLRFRVELQEQLGTSASSPGEAERDLAFRLMQSFLPAAAIVIADKENKVIACTKDRLPPQAEAGHLLDLITDVNFANLVAAAFQKEGEALRGSILFYDQPYVVGVLCVPRSESKTVRTVIALQPQAEKGEV